MIFEGKYDSLVTQLSGEILRYWKKGVDHGDQKIEFEKYVVSDANSLEFDLYMTLTLNNTGTWGVLPNSGANTGQDNQDPLIIGLFTVDQGTLPQMYREIAFTLRDFLRHEIEHLTQGGPNLRPSKKKNVMRQQRLAINQGKKPSFKYPMLKSEIEPMLQGMYFRAKKERRPFIDVVDDWFNLQGYTRQEKETILKLWNKYIPSLNLPKLVLKEEEEDFNVEAPPEWNVYYLGVGDTIKGKMWDWKKIINQVNREHRDDYAAINRDIERWKYIYDNGITIQSIETKGDEAWIDFDSNFLNWGPSVWWINKMLSDGYKIEPSLTESEEEDFNVEAPAEWNIEYLNVGDVITPDMWQNKQYDLNIQGKTAEITDIGVDDNGPYVVLSCTNPHFSLDYDLEVINDLLKPEYRIDNDLNESDEEEDFNVEAPAEWNVEYLSIGDQITPDMWNQEWIIWDLLDTDIDKTYKIIGFFEEWDGYEEQEDFDPIFVELEDETGRRFTESLTVLQGALKPKFKITQNKNLTESDNDEDFSVEAPPEWNVEQLSVGDTIDPNMWNKKKTMGLLHTDIEFDETYKISKIQDLGDWWDVDQEGFDVYEVELIDSQGQEVIDYLDNINMWLKPEFKVVKTMMESDEDEFSVEAPPEWNVTELEKGDYIMPDMWVTDIDDFFTGQPNSKYLFKQLTSKPIKITGVMRGDELYFEVSGLHFILTNDFLLPQYKVVGDFGLYESDDDEFSVDAPVEWNVTDLKVGDFITPEMIDVPKDKRKQRWYHRIFGDPLRAPGWEIKEFKEVGRIDFVRLEHKGISQFYVIDDVNKALKPQYRIFPLYINETKLSRLLEIDDEDFNVVAPPEWNVEELGVNDLITPDNSNTGNYYLIKKIVGNSVWVRKGTLDHNGEFIPQHSVDFHSSLRNLQSKMKPGFVIRG